MSFVAVCNASNEYARRHNFDGDSMQTTKTLDCDIIAANHYDLGEMITFSERSLRYYDSSFQITLSAPFAAFTLRCDMR